MGSFTGFVLSIFVIIPTLVGFLFMFLYMAINFALGLLVPFNLVFQNRFAGDLKVDDMDKGDFQPSIGTTDLDQKMNLQQKLLADKKHTA